MDSIKERLQRMKYDHKERSKNLNQLNSDDKASSSSTIQTSSDSDGIKDTKMTVQSCGHPEPEEPIQIEQKKGLRQWRSQADVNSVKRQQQQIHQVSPRASSAQAEHRDRAKSKPSRERKPSSTQSSSSTGTTNKIRVHDKYYIVLNTLGRGGSSVVYQAFSEYHKRCVAIKIVSFANADEAVTEAYEKEIQFLEKLQGSPYVIRMFDYEKRHKHLYVVMECGDIDLANFMANKADQIDDKFIKYHWQEMLKCVQVIHEHNIVHSDLKPANFLFVGASLKLIDFGIASDIPSNKTSVVKDMQLGTLNYISPEAISGSYIENGITHYKIPLKSDVWSLGCILYAMVYGRTPFQHIKNQAAKVNAISSESYVIEFPKTGKVRDRLLLDVLKKCLVRDVKARPSIEQLLKHPYLRDASLCTPSPARPPQPTTKIIEVKGNEENAKPSAPSSKGLRVIK